MEAFRRVQDLSRDIPTELLAIQMQLQELQRVHREENRRHGRPSNLQAALRLQRRDLEARGRRLGRWSTADEDDHSRHGRQETRHGHTDPRDTLQTERRLEVCVACQEEKEARDIAEVPCGHFYCRECIPQLLRTAMTDESRFPPHCCRQPIPISSVRAIIPTELFEQFEIKRVEWETADRTYCHHPTCSAFIPPRTIASKAAQCPRCENTTCAVCKGAGHGEGSCPEDAGVQEILALATARGWQRCYRCRSVVSLRSGCQHMTYAPPAPLRGGAMAD